MQIDRSYGQVWVSWGSTEGNCNTVFQEATVHHGEIAGSKVPAKSYKATAWYCGVGGGTTRMSECIDQITAQKCMASKKVSRWTINATVGMQLYEVR